MTKLPAGEGEAPTLSQALLEMESHGLQLTNSAEPLRGRKHETSYLAVLCLDVNGMGKRFTQLARGNGVDLEARQTVLETLSRASTFVRAAARQAVGQAFLSLMRTITTGENGIVLMLENILLHRIGKDEEQSAGLAFPVRPVLIAGDEMVLICEGSLATDFSVCLAQHFVENLRAIETKDPQKFRQFNDCDVSVGIGLGRAHSPFSQLHQLANRGCKDAKRISAANSGGSFVSLSFLEEQAAPDASSDLNFGVLKDSRTDKILPWTLFRQEILQPIQASSVGDLRSQIRTLASDLYKGREAVEHRRNIWSVHGVEEKIKDSGIFRFAEQEYGGDLFFLDGNSPNLHAISLMDFFPEGGLSNE